jgi:hypothetical protein
VLVRRRPLTPLVAAVSLLIPAVALAQAPGFGRYRHGRYSSATVGKTRNDFFDFTIMDRKCDEAPATTVRKVQIGKGGTFAYAGRMRSPLGEKGWVVLKGHFVSAAKLVFTYSYRKRSPHPTCRSKRRLTYRLDDSG